jgi:hypothetical protein
VRSASLAKGGTSKKRLSLHLHKVLTQSNKVSHESSNFENGLHICPHHCILDFTNFSQNPTQWSHHGNGATSEVEDCMTVK